MLFSLLVIYIITHRHLIYHIVIIQMKTAIMVAYLIKENAEAAQERYEKYQ